MTGSLKSYRLTEEEVRAAESGELDLVGGFHVIDADCRTIVVEGLAPSMAEVLAAAPRRGVNDGSYRVLADPSVRFTRRLFAAFNTDLKKIRLRAPLPTLAESPEIYNRTKVSTECFEALDRLVGLRRAPSLRVLAVAEGGGLPEVRQLIEVESKFGEPITMTDIDGWSPKIARASAEFDDGAVARVDDDDAGAGFAEKKRETIRRKAATDTNNQAFVDALKHRDTTDWLALRKGENHAAGLVWEARKLELLAERALDKVPATYVYSGQKLQYTELKKAEQRARLAKEKNVVFVKSMQDNFLSLIVPMVDEGNLERDEAAASRAKWKTARGFVYPAPKVPGSYNVHPQKPSESRVEQLREEWVENELHQDQEGRVSEPEKFVEPNVDFDTIPCFPQEFGGFRPPEFEREYDGSHLGDIRRLPRGRVKSDKYDNTTYMKSVHLTENAAEEAAARKRIAEEEWKSRVVVDDVDFKVGNFLQKDRPSQLDRTNDILDGPALSTALKIVRNAKLPSGKRTRLRPPPYSIFATGEYAEARDFSAELRRYPGELAGRTETGEPVDFQTRIHRDTLRRASEKILCGRHVTTIHPSEVVGDARWHSGNVDLGRLSENS